MTGLSIDLGGADQRFGLAYAIMVYLAGRDGHGPAFATLHEPANGRGGVLQLGPGAPISTSFLRELTRTVGGSAVAEVFPPTVLARTADAMVWWRPPRPASLFFSVFKDDAGAKVLNGISGRIMAQPGLVFRATNAALWVRAVPGVDRPDASTTLCNAPYYNVDVAGRVCLGSMRVPATGGVSAISAWETAFFESEFTHALAAVTLTKHPDGFAAMWRAVARRKRQASFPTRFLVPAGKRYGRTLAQFVSHEEAEAHA